MPLSIQTGDDDEPTSPTSPTSPTWSWAGSMSPLSPKNKANYDAFRSNVTVNLESVLGIESDERKKERKKNSMRAFSRANTLDLNRSPSAMLSNILFTPRQGTEQSDLSLTARTANSSALEKEYVKDRRGTEKEKAPSLYTVVDSKAEKYFQDNLERPWCLDSCMQNEDCQRYCHPAEYATKHRNVEDDQGGGGGAGEGEQVMFGLPDWTKSGFCLMPGQDVHWPDNLLVKRLGLQAAVHRKTSVERLCLVRHKDNLPKQVSKEHILGVVKSLKKCDHVNVLRCYEVCEDNTSLYFLYENFPCVTLLSFLEEMDLSENQLVNLVRELCAAVAYTTTIGLTHLGWTLCHVLLPVTCKHGDPMVAKLFGFGLMGNVHLECSDRMCWAPEAVESWVKIPDTFITRMENQTKITCDYWSLGVLIYTLIARRPPMMGRGEALTEMIVSRKWAFALSFDEVDREAKSLVEGLLEGNMEKRLKPEQSLRSEWIRRRWRPPANGHRTFLRLEEFCASPLPKRLFGRFLVRFLDAEHMRQISLSFYALDSQGDGVICMKDLALAAKMSDRHHGAKTIFDWMCIDSPTISVGRFAESMAEEVIDGRALRHAFESLDDDGSECVSAEELHQELFALDENVTLEQIQEHIAQAEDAAEDAENGVPKVEGQLTEKQLKEAEPRVDKENDNMIHFDEFLRLFPVRVQRMKDMADRIQGTHDHANHVHKLYLKAHTQAQTWLKQIEDEKKAVEKLALVICSRPDKQDAEQAVKDLKRHIHRVGDYLRHPPGPVDAKGLAALMQADKKKKHKNQEKGQETKDTGLHDVYGFDSFMQDRAIKECWAVLCNDEVKTMRHAMIMETNGSKDMVVDTYKAADASETLGKKLTEIVSWANFQMEEYHSIVEVLVDPEPPTPFVTFSSRGLQKHGEDAEDEDGEQDDVKDADGLDITGCIIA